MTVINKTQQELKNLYDKLKKVVSKPISTRG